MHLPGTSMKGSVLYANVTCFLIIYLETPNGKKDYHNTNPPLQLKPKGKGSYWNQIVNESFRWNSFNQGEGKKTAAWGR